MASKAPVRARRAAPIRRAPTPERAPLEQPEISQDPRLPVSAGGLLGQHQLLRLQRSAGNQAVLGLLQRCGGTMHAGCACAEADKEHVVEQRMVVHRRVDTAPPGTPASAPPAPAMPQPTLTPPATTPQAVATPAPAALPQITPPALQDGPATAPTAQGPDLGGNLASVGLGSERLLQSLTTVAPSSFTAALGRTRTSGETSLASDTTTLANALPEITQPTGLPTAAAPGPLSGTPPPQATTSLPSGNASAKGPTPPPTPTPPATGPLPADRLTATVDKAPEALVQQLPTTDASVSTSAGAPPHVDLTADADPALASRDQTAAGTQVVQQQQDANRATTIDFGEQKLGPTLTPAKLKASVVPKAPPALPAAPTATTALDAKYRTDFDASAAEELHEPIAEQHALYQQQRNTYTRTSREAQKESTRQLDDETSRSRVQQLDLRNQAHADITEEKQRWQTENQKVRNDFNTTASARRLETDRQVQDKVTTANAESETKLAEAEKEAEAERGRAEAEAAQKKAEAEAKPKSWWDSVKDTVSSVFDSIKSAVNSIFDRLRQAVKRIIDTAKNAVHAVIDAARRAVVGLIQAFGEVLKGLVSVALAAFPSIAARARAWIDARIQTAVSAVNRVADALKSAADAILNTLGKALDAALAVLQAAFVKALSALEAIAKAVVDGMQALARLAAWIQKNMRFLDGAKKLMDNPDQVIEAIRTKLGEMIADVPAKAMEKLNEFGSKLGAGPAPAAASGGATVQRAVATPAAPVTRHVGVGQHLAGIGRCLEAGLEHLKAHWWDELKKVGWNLLWPWPAVWNDLKGIGADIKAGLDDARHLRVSKVIDRVLSMDQKLNSILGNLYGWFFIASVLVGTIIGAFFGGAGALPGALAGAAFAGEVGEALVAALIGTETAVILKSIADLAIGNDTADQDQEDYQKIGGSILTISITLAMMLLGEIAADLAKAIWDGVAGLLRGGEAPKVDADVNVKPGDADAPKAADADAVPDDASSKGVAAERTGADGHKIKVLDDGRVFICTTCEELHFKYGDELDAHPELKEKLDAANAETDPQAKADKVAELQKELSDARKQKMAGETPEAKAQLLDSMLEKARQALARLKEALSKKVGKLQATDGPLKGKVEAEVRELDRAFSDAEGNVDTAKELKDADTMDEYREKLDDVRAKADELKKQVDDAVPDQPDDQPADQPGDDPAGGDLRTLRVKASRPEARVIENPAERFPRKQALAIDEAQVVMNDLFREGASHGDGSTAFMAMLEQAKAGVGKDPVPIAGDTLHATKCADYSKGLTDIISDKGPDLPVEAQQRLRFEVSKMQEALDWATRFKNGESPAVPGWAKPFAGELLGM